MTERTEKILTVFLGAGIVLDARSAERLDVYYETLVETNRVMNLTAVTEFNEVLYKHFLDSAYLFKILGSEAFQGKQLVDVGTGAGFPGMVLKIVRPELDLTLLDALEKRIGFLNNTASLLSLSGITFVHARSEDAGKAGSSMREKFDVSTARAVAELRVLAEYCLPLTRVGGVFVSYKGPEAADEVERSRHAIEVLGGTVENVMEYTLPGTDYRRTMVVVRKEKETPREYPRKSGKITKSPL
ncbi:MAG: 16S rRNA (guanine(527)-N(7))-methyltransferase RsmG [Lachnospiraceae bacterium]|nr:16S rRNA (guanine(527)-N(7))-methyltransferase RsmG [Lachnospiraceae bacterium]